MKKRLYKEQKHSLYQMAQNTGTNIMFFYGYADGSKDIDNMGTGVFLRLAKFEAIDPMKLYIKIKEYQKTNN